MKTNHAYNRNEYRTARTTHPGSTCLFVCTICLIVSFSAGPATAASGSNTPIIVEPNDPDTAQTPAPSTVQEPNQPTDPNTPSIVAEPNDLDSIKAPALNTAEESNRPYQPTIDKTNTIPLNLQSTSGPAKRDWLIAEKPKTDLARKIWRDRITVPQDSEAADHKKQLKELIDRIRSIEFKPPEPPSEPIVVLKKPSPADPNTRAPEPADQNEPAPEETVSTKHQVPPVSEETLNLLLKQLEKPDLLKNPFELGEILFNAGRLKEAAVCYRQALARTAPNRPDTEKRRPWILFQIGNCLRNTEPAKATEAYSKLITEHGGSLWAEPAKAQAALIAWREKESPQLLIEQSRSKPVQKDMPLRLLIKNESNSKTELTTGEQTQDESQP